MATVKIAWGKKVSTEFVNRVLAMCHRFGWSTDHASWLMSCMAFESGESFRSDIKNAAGSGATGLIQFMPATAKGLGTSVEYLSQLTPVQQLEWVERYFKPYYRRINNLGDMYMAILLPSAVGKPGESPLFSGGIAYRQNSGLDKDKDGVVTKNEAAAKVYAKFEKGMRDEFVLMVSV